MSCKYLCDACGKEVESFENLKFYKVNWYEVAGCMSTGTKVLGDLCPKCYRAIDYAASTAALNELERIRKA